MISNVKNARSRFAIASFLRFSFLFYVFLALFWINRYSTKKHSIGEMFENRSYIFSLIKTFYKQTHIAQQSFWYFNLDHHKFSLVSRKFNRFDHDCSELFLVNDFFHNFPSPHYWIFHISHQFFNYYTGISLIYF